MKQLFRFGIAAVVVTLSIGAWAEPLWHRSRLPKSIKDKMALAETADQFSLASTNSSPDIISISVRDLIDVYSGRPVKVSGEPLSACFMIGDSELSRRILTSLGLNQAVIQSLSKKSSIVQSKLFWVSDEAEMQECIIKHFPAVGYLNNPTSNNDIEPCF